MATTPPPGSTQQPPRPSTPPTGREVTITARQIQPPSPVYLQPEDTLLFTAWTASLALPFTIALFIRFLRPDGEISATKRVLTVQVSGQALLIPLGEGFLLSAATIPVTGFPTPPGRLFTTLTVARELPNASDTHWPLFGDYLTSIHFPSWPSGRNLLPTEGPGFIRSITGTTPGAGAEINETVPAQARWRLLMGSMTLTTSAAVANRNPVFVIDDGSNILYRWNPTVVVTAGSVARLTFAAPPQPGVSDGTGEVLFIPDTIFMNSSFRFRTATGSLQAGDQYSAPQYLVQEWVEL